MAELAKDIGKTNKPNQLQKTILAQLEIPFIIQDIVGIVELDQTVMIQKNVQNVGALLQHQQSGNKRWVAQFSNSFRGLIDLIKWLCDHCGEIVERGGRQRHTKNRCIWTMRI